MHKLHVLVFLALTGVLISCTGFHKGEYLTNNNSDIAIDDGIVVSAEIMEHLSSTTKSFIEFTFENKTANKKILKDVEFQFKNDKRSYAVEILDLNASLLWLHQAIARNEKRHQDDQLVIEILSEIARTAMLSESRRTGRNGKVLNNAVIISSISQSTEKLSNDIINQKINNHTAMMTGDVVIRPGLFVRKWLLLSADDAATLENMEQFEMRFHDQHQRRYDYSVPFETVSNPDAVFDQGS